MPRKKKPSEEQQKWAWRYEAAWYQIFWEMAEWRQIEIIEGHDGRTARELAKECRKLAEDENFKPKKDYQKIPTDAKELRAINYVR